MASDSPPPESSPTVREEELQCDDNVGMDYSDNMSKKEQQQYANTEVLCVRLTQYSFLQCLHTSNRNDADFPIALTQHVFLVAVIEVLLKPTRNLTLFPFEMGGSPSWLATERLHSHQSFAKAVSKLPPHEKHMFFTRICNLQRKHSPCRFVTVTLSDFWASTSCGSRK